MEDTSCSASATKSLPTGVGLEGLPRQKSRQHSLHSSKSITLGTRSLPREFTTMAGEVFLSRPQKICFDPRSRSREESFFVESHPSFFFRTWSFTEWEKFLLSIRAPSQMSASWGA